MATHSSILAWRIPWTEEPERLSPWGHKSWTRLSEPRIIFLQRDSPSYLDNQPGLRTQKVPCRQNHLILNLYPNTGGGWPCSQGPLLRGLNLDHSLKRPLERILTRGPPGSPFYIKLSLEGVGSYPTTALKELHVSKTPLLTMNNQYLAINSHVLSHAYFHLTLTPLSSSFRTLVYSHPSLCSLDLTTSRSQYPVQYRSACISGVKL